jgi:hypothetical protein
VGVIVTGKVFTPAPAGAHQAVCVDVVELGEVETEYKGEKKKKRMVKLVWQINELNQETGRRFAVARRYGAYLSEKATLRKDLQSWRGRPFNPEELRGFDLEVLLGINCQLNIVHKEVEGSTYANVEAVMPLMKGMPKIEPLEYTREKDRKPGDGHDGDFQATDEDVPF